jgi:hypothetical protein
MQCTHFWFIYFVSAPTHKPITIATKTFVENVEVCLDVHSLLKQIFTKS